MKRILTILMYVALSVGLVSINDCAYSQAPTTVATAPAYSVVNPADLVKNPTLYLNKKITMTSRFSKYSTLGLDYKPALRESDNYVTLLFLKNDSANKIPQSELKMFVSRKVAEKLPDIKEGDKIRVNGQVFSDALGDAWVDLEKIEQIK